MHIYQLLPYVLSTSFSTHPKPLTWDRKPFQSRRVHFFRHYETFLLFSALWHWFFSEIFFIVPPINFWYFATEWMFKKSQSVPLLHFSALCDLPETSKKFRKKIRKFFSQFLVFWELLLSPVVEKVVFVFLSLRYGADLGRSRLVLHYAAWKVSKTFRRNRESLLVRFISKLFSLILVFQVLTV